MYPPYRSLAWFGTLRLRIVNTLSPVHRRHSANDQLYVLVCCYSWTILQIDPSGGILDEGSNTVSISRLKY